ncbi:hypothetical protein AUK40_04420 [Candidatus Wirthbacteria bacterium CG2_30_54_11]|uniref:S-adenosylmethionine-dependent methyltransferase domain-containing protein n=1 Tax=Candidatus Wirthbacteria bacterium CG2_30_54_11 TaxID=1817892 RepID=A0A1J5IJK3_9BACT|nr:MAG: hypothetical protein AUK40_04420 [Candidatus Wirthbacteria bacterium CG2_30_54_11]
MRETMPQLYEQIVKQALDKRKDIASADTNCFRLIDGAGDGCPGLWIDWFDGRALIQIKDENSFSIEELQELASELQAGSAYLKLLDQHQKESPVHLAGRQIEQPFCVLENGIRYEVDFMSGYSQGIFLDQRNNRQEVGTRVQIDGKDARVLNLFAYTCGFSVAAAVAGAITTSVDLSRTYLNWGQKNFQHNSLNPAQHYFTKGDVFQWLLAFARKGRTWHSIILDPPTFSRGEKKKVFRVENDYGELVHLSAQVLEPDGWMLCCANTRTHSAEDFEQQVQAGIQTAGRSILSKHFAPMPCDFPGEQYLKSLWIEVKQA